MDEKKILDEAERFLKNNKRNIISDLRRLVEIESTKGEEKPGMPYGEGPRKALDTALDMAREMGFEPEEYEGHMGWFDLEGEQKEHIATITHLDVVPAGEGWHFKPYELEEKGNWVVGRGTDDDKGPLIYCMYLAKFFKESGIKLKYTLRTLMGCNEETGMNDVVKYLEKYPEPLFCLSSDALFPICNGEKGLMEGELVIPHPDGNILELVSGHASNMIPEQAYCVLQNINKQLSDTESIKVTAENGLTRIDAYGTGAHCAMPERGVSAVGILMDYLLENDLAAPDEIPAAELLRDLHKHPYGEGLGIDSKDEIFGSLTCAGGILRMESGRFKQNINIRYPMSIKSGEIIERLEDKARKAGGEFCIISYSDPFYISEDDKVIKTLMKSYKDAANDEAPPYTWGGGTYARRFKRAVSFGPGLSGEEDQPADIGCCHGADEGTNLETLDKAFLIYVLSILRLQELSSDELQGK